MKCVPVISRSRAYQSIIQRAILAENQEVIPPGKNMRVYPILDSAMDGYFGSCPPLLSDDLQDDLKEYDPIAEIADRLDASMLEGRHPLDRAQYTWSKCQLEGQILNWGGVWIWQTQWSLAAFLDHHLAEIAVKIPPNLRIHGNVEKYVLREAVRGYCPRFCTRRSSLSWHLPLIPMRVNAGKWAN